jgi:cytochrome c553
VKRALTVIIVTAALGAGACSRASASHQTTAASDRVKRGEYLVSVVGCGDCHTPMKMGANGPEPDVARFLSGHPEQIGQLPPASPQGPWMWSGRSTPTCAR